MNVENHKHSERVWFYKIGIAGKDNIDNRKWDLRTLASIIKMLNHTNKKIDILKMDMGFRMAFPESGARHKYI